MSDLVQSQRSLPSLRHLSVLCVSVLICAIQVEAASRIWGNANQRRGAGNAEKAQRRTEIFEAP
jgi:hypothetical protein